MRRRSIASVAQALARVWLAASAISLLLPNRDRLGWWLPLHLALAGAATAAVAGAAPDFAAAISAGRVPGWGWLPLVLFGMGTSAIAVGFPSGAHWLVAVGGTAFGLGGLVLAATVRSAWRSGLNRRHAVIARLYVFAATCPAVGASLGAVMGTGVVSGTAFLDVRRAHVAANLAGFLNLTVVATSVLLVPTVLRVRMPRWRAALPFATLAAGVSVAMLGSALGLRTMAALGALAYAIGSLEVLVGALLAIKPWPANPERSASMHLLAALGWLAVGSAAWTALLAAGTSDRRLAGVVIAFALGVVVQAMVGAWSHLVPMSAPGGPDVHRRSLARADVGAIPQVLLLNAGVLTTCLAAGGALPGPIGTAGAVAVVVAVLVAVGKISVPSRPTGGSRRTRD